MRMTCNGCGTESNQDGILKHKSSCVTQPQIHEHNTMPSTTIKFDSPEEQQKFTDGLTKGNGMVATVKEATTEPVKSATPIPLTTNEELEDVTAFLCGEKPLDGYWYGDKPKDRPAFWWRKKLKRAIDQQIKEAVNQATPGATKRRISQSKCLNGHKGYYAKNKRGHNYCKKCANIANQKHYKKRKATLTSDKQEK